jgi:hypothetical protein
VIAATSRLPLESQMCRRLPSAALRLFQNPAQPDRDFRLELERSDMSPRFGGARTTRSDLVYPRRSPTTHTEQLGDEASV